MKISYTRPGTLIFDVTLLRFTFTFGFFLFFPYFSFSFLSSCTFPHLVFFTYTNLLEIKAFLLFGKLPPINYYSLRFFLIVIKLVHF
jgi:hypothetical protein